MWRSSIAKDASPVPRQTVAIVKFFSNINDSITADKVTYDVVTDYGKLMSLVGGAVT